MVRIIFIMIMTLICFLCQMVFATVLGSWLTPNFVLLAVIFFNLYRGLRHSLGAAFFGGFLLDSYSGAVGGVNIFCLVVCAYLIAWVKKYLYQPGVSSSRIVVAFLIVLINGLMQFLLTAARADVPFMLALKHALLPEMVCTALVTGYTFERLRYCVSKIFA